MGKCVLIRKVCERFRRRIKLENTDIRQGKLEAKLFDLWILSGQLPKKILCIMFFFSLTFYKPFKPIGRNNKLPQSISFINKLFLIFHSKQYYDFNDYISSLYPEWSSECLYLFIYTFLQFFGLS